MVEKKNTDHNLLVILQYEDNQMELEILHWFLSYVWEYNILEQKPQK